MPLYSVRSNHDIVCLFRLWFNRPRRFRLPFVFGFVFFVFWELKCCPSSFTDFDGNSIEWCRQNNKVKLIFHFERKTRLKVREGGRQQKSRPTKFREVSLVEHKILIEFLSPTVTPIWHTFYYRSVHSQYTTTNTIWFMCECSWAYFLMGRTMLYSSGTWTDQIKDRKLFSTSASKTKINGLALFLLSLSHSTTHSILPLLVPPLSFYSI